MSYYQGGGQDVHLALAVAAASVGCSLSAFDAIMRYSS